MRYLAYVMYDGYNYEGFQYQNEETATIEKSLKEAFLILTKQNIKIYPSGRTDSKVHAKAQTFHFDFNNITNLDTFKEGLNRILPLDIRITKILKVNDTFHARHCAKMKEYRYYISKKEPTPFNNRYCAYVGDLNVSVMQKSISLFEGLHDFKAFSVTFKNSKPTTKIIYSAKIKETRDKIVIIFIGNSFLRYMVRRMVGLLIEIGKLKKDSTIINEMFQNKENTIIYKTAIPMGLFLHKVYYK
ncbi:MAG: tRNA pseudouridine(38-40) synthase TruA [Acholeplasmatales bacterium]|nr:tRNA pseudouridine(38-40) synthase TruA [Acholeplasmatales bacterium]